MALTKAQLSDKLQQIKALALELEQGLDDVIEVSDSGVINELYLEVTTVVESITKAETYNKRVQNTYNDQLKKGKSK